MNRALILSFAIGPVATAFIGLATVPALSWLFSQEDVARYSLLQLVFSLALLACSLGLDQSFVREYHERKNTAGLLLNSISPALVIFLLFITPFSVIYSGYLSDFFDYNLEFESLVLLIGCLCYVVNRYLSLLLRMREKGYSYSFSLFTPKFIFLILILSSYFTNFSDFTYILVFWSMSIASNTLYLVLVNRRYIISALNECIDLPLIKKLLWFALPLYVGTIAFWGLTTLGRLFLNELSSLKELAIYSVSFSFAGVAVILQTVFSSMWTPYVYKKSVDGIELREYINIVDEVRVLVAIATCLVGAFSWIIPLILPVEYNSVQYILVSCMMYPILYTLSEASGVGLGISRKSSAVMGVTFLALIVNVIANYVLIPLFGASGAAIATALSFWILLLAKTEAASYYWKSFQRSGLYLTSFVLVSMSIFHTAYGPSMGIWSNIIWLMLLLAFVLFNTQTVKNVIHKFKK